MRSVLPTRNQDTAARHLSANLREWPNARGERGGPGVYGERTMVRLVLHALLYSGTAAFVTGIVIAAAKFII